eukprot:TRINITY_DN1867_c0_g1_i1.p1 TRINITY_DN1867_c0_g1~~TRINITY_DN1867_c0_g1_i1.p1  ORF type:complete len:1143 (+),score=392.91 TRINITY_DN1867_c0_g1_i1:240-3431(+)
MSQPKFTSKRVGYLAASQSYDDKTDVTLLATHLIRKDMTSANQFEAGVAASCLANICTPELAKDLAADVVTMLNSGRPYVRKKACLVLYKIFLRFPDALRPSFQRLKEKLEDPEPSVQAAAVNVICELSRKNPKNYIGLAPVLFKLLTSSQSNWMLIKLVKLFGALLPIEPRLGKKLAGPLSNLISTTPAMSLLYECIQTCTLGLGDHVPTIKLCLTKLRLFVEDSDQNLKYLGLLALNNIIKVQPKAVAEHRDLVMNCLDDEDVNIRLRALDLLEGMVSKKNLIEIVRKLLDHLDKADSMSYKDAVTEKIILVCSKDSYKYLTDFEWYIAVLAELARSPNMKHGVMISGQFMDLIIRVPILRPVGVKLMATLLKDARFFSENPQEGGNCEVLYAAGWVVGEFCSEHIKDHLAALESLLVPSAATLPAHIQGVYMQAVVKIFGVLVGDGSAAPVVQNLLDPTESVASSSKPVDQGKANAAIKILQERLPLYTQSSHLEVQERACFAMELVNIYLETNGAIGPEIRQLFAEPLNPVKHNSWKAIKVPDGLNLDEWINEPPAPISDKFEDTGNFDFLKPEMEQWEKTIGLPSEEELARRQEYKAARPKNPWLLDANVKADPREDEDLSPLRKLPSDIIAEIDSSVDFVKPGHRSSKNKKPQKYTVLKVEDVGGEDNNTVGQDEDKTGLHADLDLNAPLRAEEQFRAATHRVVAAAPAKADKKKTRKTSATGDKAEKTTKKKGTKSVTNGKKSSKASKEGSGNLLDLGGFDSIGTPPVTPVAPVAEVKESRQVKESKKKSTKSTTTKKTSTKKSSKSTTSSANQSNLLDVPTGLPASPPPQKQANKFRPLCQDDQIGAVYEIRVSPSDPRRFLCAFAFKNVGSAPISDLKVDVRGTLNVKMSGPSPSLTNFVLQPGQANTHDIFFDVGSFEQLQKIGGLLSYTAGYPRTLEFQLVLPSSAFVVPVALPKEEFFTLLGEGQFASQATTVRYDGDFNAVVVALAVALHSELVTTDERGAALYGKTTQGHHVATYIKMGNPAQVMLRCSSAPLAMSLVGEIQALFPSRV